MIKSHPGEIWKVLDMKGANDLKYALSSYGRLVSYFDSIQEGILLQCGTNKGYKVFKKYSYTSGKRTSKTYYLHKLVAEQFLPQKQDNQVYVIHLNFVKDDNRVDNLKWANKQQMEAHQSKNPRVIEERKRLQEHNKLCQYKLSEAKVKILKRKLLDPNRKTRLKMIAKNFGVSEMQLYRIKTGENWGHVKP
jgi:hypothetical protein